MEEENITQYTPQFQKGGILVGLQGAHRTGKTTVAKNIGKLNPHIPYIATNASQIIMDKYGADINAPINEKYFLDFQETLIDELDIIWREQNFLAITDRTPVDIAAYTIIKTKYSDLFDVNNARIERILNKCKKSLNHNFGLLIHLSPGIAYVEEKGKPPLNKVYQEIHNNICIGWGINNFQNIEMVPKKMVEHTERMDYIVPLINNFIDEINLAIDENGVH